jgi:hypothetical protein
MLSRIEKARLAKVPITNYGVVITHCHTLLTRALSPLFPRPEEFETLTPNSYNLSERLRESNGNNRGT